MIHVSGQMVKAMLKDEEELALLDVREQGQFGREHLVLTSTDGVLAHLTAEDVKTFPGVLSAKVLEGGTRAWIEAGRPVTGGMERPISEVMDLYYKPYEHTDAPEAAMSGYLTWEVGLVDQIKRDGTAGFRAFHHNEISRKSHRPEYSA